jgi:NitT/TauT family transport system substrate-binding protein
VLAVRQDLYDAGRGRQLADLRTLSVAITPPGKGTSSACALAAGLQRVGLKLDDLNIQPITFPDMVPAFANGAIDTAMIAEPFMTRAQRQGSVVKLMGIDEMYPNFVISTVGLAPSLYENRQAAKGYVRAYIRGIRTYLDAISGRASEAEREQVYEIIAKYTRLDVPTIREMSPPGYNVNGLPNKDALLYCYQFFREQGLIPEPVSEAAMAAAWGTELVEEVLAEIGRVPER